DQSNTSVMFGRQLIMKMFRRLEPGPNPDVEIGGYLTRSGFTRVPPLRGAIDYFEGRSSVSAEAAPQGEPAVAPVSLVMLQEVVPNQGNGWQVTIEELGRYFERVTGLPMPAASDTAIRAFLQDGGPIPGNVAEAIRTYLATADVLGRRTGELHVQLAEAHDEPALAPESYTAADIAQTVEAMRRHGDQQLRQLQERLPMLEPRAQERARDLLANR